MKILIRFLPVAAVALGACASIVSGRTQPMSFVSNPEGATITVNGKVLGKTPLTTTMEKKSGQAVVFSKEGYKPLSMQLETSLDGWFWGNIVFGGLVGSTTDGVTGAVHKYSPSQYMITLEPDGSTKMDAKPLLDASHKAKEYIVVAYRNIKEEFNKSQVGDYSKSLLAILKIPTAEQKAALEKIKALLSAYQDIPTFADRTIEMFLESAGSAPRPQPVSALVEEEVARADWSKISADASVKIYSKTGEILIGNRVNSDDDYFWIFIAGGTKKAVLASEIDKIVVLKR